MHARHSLLTVQMQYIEQFEIDHFDLGNFLDEIIPIKKI
jgi:hypothetical protein